MKKDLILSQLILLITLFLVGIFSLISLHLIFTNIIEELNVKTKNLKAKIEIGSFVVDDLISIRSDFYELAILTNNDKSREVILSQLDDKVDSIHKALTILEYGGTLKRKIDLNVVNKKSSTRIIKYKNENKKEFSLESIDIRPKLLQIETMIVKLDFLLSELDKYDNNPNEFMSANKKIKRFYRTIPAYFSRMIENASRLLYEGQKELKIVEAEIQKKILYYEKMELILVITIILAVLVFGYFIARGIIRNTKVLKELNFSLDSKVVKLKQQEQYIRNILDSQSSIVVVSDGSKMLDANDALMNFFNDFDSFDSFKSTYKCICECFEDIGDKEFIFHKDYDGLLWYEYILKNKYKDHKVAMFKLNTLHYFSITVKKMAVSSKKDDFILIITLNNLTREISTQKELKDLNDNLENLVNEKTKALQELNENLEQRIIIEVEKNRNKDKKLLQQSRFAALGEMIGNIAHQWRQPLSAISSTSSSMKLQIDLNLSNEEEIKKSYDKIIKYVEFLSQTIEDFRGFFKKDKEKIEFNIKDTIDKSMAIIHAVFKDNTIALEEKYEDNLLTIGYPNELSQVFLNIFNNAKDALKEKNEPSSRFIKIDGKKSDDNIIITITDNAGGIPEDILEKVFDPYFTTKHKSQGTGIGLYMSKEIIEKNMGGRLKVKNVSISKEDKLYKGASFIITLPSV